MSSMIFQPLLHDPLGWKSNKSTYADHYKWKKYRSGTKEKKRYSDYSQTSHRAPPTTATATTIIPSEQTIKPIVLLNKTEENRGRTSVANKTPPLDQTPVNKGNEEKVRAASVHQTVRVPSAPAQLEKKSPIDPNNDNNRHWLTYPNPKTPEYIIDIKKRLGQWKVPSTLGRTSATSNRSENAEAAPTAADTRPSSASSQKTTKNEDQHNFLSFERRDTPDELRAARHRLDKHRYNPSLDSHPTRPKTCPVRPTTETTATAVTEEQEKQVNEVWTEENNPFEQDSTPSIVVQMVDCDGLPPEYAEALETANAAQEEYLKSLNMTSERRLDSAVYRLPAMTPDSVTAYQTQQTSMPTNHYISPSRQGHRTATAAVPFGTWVRNASDKERASAMKILQDVLQQPVSTMDSTNKTKPIFKQAPAPPPTRAKSATRKLGRTRTQHKFPCEICEKLLIKRHVWDLNGPDSVACTHDRSQVKPASRP